MSTDAARRTMPIRSASGVDDQAPNALRAAVTAAWASSAVPWHTRAITSAVAGLRTSAIAGEVEATQAPPMN